MENEQHPVTNNQSQKIQIEDNFVGGEYANGMQVTHTKEEFLITFLNIVSPRGRVSSKIISGPGHVKRMIATLQDNLRKYEDKFGAVEAAENPKDKIGFQI